jgi:hypothetical protein
MNTLTLMETCTVLLTSGERKNQPCAKKAHRSGGGLCVYHIKKAELASKAELAPAVSTDSVQNLVQTAVETVVETAVQTAVQTAVTPILPDIIVATTVTPSECAFILKKGERKGQVCGKKKCVLHKNAQPIVVATIATVPTIATVATESESKIYLDPLDPKQVVTKDKPDSGICSFILKKGDRKGQVCGKKKCVLHKEKLTEHMKIDSSTAQSDVQSGALGAQVETIKTIPQVQIPQVQIIQQITSDELCGYLFIKGVKKGEKCGKKKCTLHKKIETVTKDVKDSNDVKDVKVEPVSKSSKSSKSANNGASVTSVVHVEKDSDVKVEKVEKVEPIIIQEMIQESVKQNPDQSQQSQQPQKSQLIPASGQIQIQHPIAIENKIDIVEENLCNRVLKKGKRAGELCCKKVSRDGLCWFHRVQDPTQMDTDGFISSEEENLPEPLDFCQILLKHGKYSGFRCGNMCEEGAKVCTYHLRVNY